MPLIFLISAPSGSGKSTLVNRLLAADGSFVFSVSYTTRPSRAGEVEGENYHFISKADFEQMIARRELLEYADVHGNYYGTARSVLVQAEAERKDLILDIDVQGAAQLREREGLEVVTIFILPPSKDVLERRLRNRSTDSEEVIARRLRGAAREVSDYHLYDYVLVNDDVEQSSEQLRGIVLAERARQHRARERIAPILQDFEVDAGS